MKKPILLLLFFAMVLQGCEKSSKNTEVYREAAKEIPVIGHPDVLVVGAGPSSIGAAIAAARMGAKTMLTFYVPADHATKSFFLEPYNNIHFSRYAIYLHVKD